MQKGPSPGPLQFGGWEDEQEPAQGTEEGWPDGGRGPRREPCPEAECRKCSQKLRNGSCNCCSQVGAEAGIIISEDMKHLTRAVSQPACRALSNFHLVGSLQKPHESRTPKSGIRLMKVSVGSSTPRDPAEYLLG